MDETTLQVNAEADRPASSTSYMWLQRGGPPGQQVVLFDYDASRAGRVPVRLLSDYAGCLVTDGYEGYAEVVRKNGITHAGCWAHARRKFVEAQKVQPKGKTGKADWALNQIRKLYANHGARKALDDLLEAGEAVAVQIENQEAPYYALTATLDNTLRQQKNHLHLLSPFDNITIDRDRLLDLFDFHYRIECYTPAPKRQYGYFTLPILWNGSFIGRLDPKAERKSQTFLVRNIVFEPGFKDYDALLPALAKELHRFAAFNGCTSIRVERTKPGKFKTPLNRILKNN